MSDPYSILGVSRDATDDEIKKAYRSLSRKYHPDANINNPNKEQAEAKFKEVQQAYQQIMREREYGTSGNYNSSGSYGPFGGYDDYGPFRGFNAEYRHSNSNSGNDESEEDLHLRAAANYINSGHYREALNLLNNISSRNAQWYYYSALANSGAGNNVLALEHAKEALRRDPDNFQYQMLVNRLESGGSWYQQRQGPYQTTFSSSGNWCMKLCIANIVCNLCCNGLCCSGGGSMPGGYI
ncbi:MAG: DnaJ domain-containing protein [Lachnospiraceae bacterium]